MINRYAGEIRINPVAILRNDDFNNDGAIASINEVLHQTLEINEAISQRVSKLKAHLLSTVFSGPIEFHFSDGGYIGMKGFTDEELLDMKSKGLIDLFDFATDKNWVKKYGVNFGLAWEDGRAVRA